MKATNEWMKDELIKVFLEQCPYEIPEGEEELAKEILRGIIFQKPEKEGEK